MRVYQLAKELGLSNKELIDNLATFGFVANSHMSAIPDDVVAKVQKSSDASKGNASKDISSSKVESLQQEKIKLTEEGSSVDVANELKKTVSFKDQVSDKNGGLVQNSDLEEDEEDFEEEILVKKSSPVIPMPKPSYEQQFVSDEDLERSFSSYGKAPSVATGPGIKEAFRPSRPRKRGKRRPRIVVHDTVLLQPKSKIEVFEPLLLSELVDKLGRPVSEVILAFLRMGKAFSLNSTVDLASVKSLCAVFGVELLTASKAPVSQDGPKMLQSKLQVASTGKMEHRKPIVVVMGHVDHGKTTLIDYIRKTHVADSEHGGITQSITAYDVSTKVGEFVLIDTPGHEAFSLMRQCGAKITDIAVIIIAADDGIMPQTREALSAAKSFGAQIVIAINKVDKPGVAQNIEQIKAKLSKEFDVLVEEWGGSTVCVEISAKTGQKVDELLEMIILQSQLLDLKANATSAGRAFVLESKYIKGFGPTAVVIVTEGVINRGDFFACGGEAGKIRLLESSTGKQVVKAGPATLVKIIGFDSLPKPGDIFSVLSAIEYKSAKSGKLVLPEAEAKAAERATMILGLDQNLKLDKTKIKVVLKAATGGELDALKKAVENSKKRDKSFAEKFVLVAASAGEVNSQDVTIAEDSGAMVLVFGTTIDRRAGALASEKGVLIEHYSIIYKLVEAIEEKIKQKVDQELVLREIGQAEVIAVFPMKGKGVIAGCRVVDGKISRNAIIDCVRAGKPLCHSSIMSLQHAKKSVSEIKKGLECGLLVDGFNGWQIGDKVLCYEQVRRSEV